MTKVFNVGKRFSCKEASPVLSFLSTPLFVRNTQVQNGNLKVRMVCIGGLLPATFVRHTR